MRKKVLITGASGFVGYHLVESAISSGYEVTAAIRSSSNTSHLKHLPISFVSLEMGNKDLLRKELEKGGYNFVIHNAGATRASSENEFLKINAHYTRNLAEAALLANKDLEKFVFMSSLAASGPKASTAAGLISENDQAAPVTAYGRSKLMAENFLKEIKGLPYLVFRPTAVYGPREKDLFIVFQNINKGLETYLGTKPQVVSFIYVSDLAKLVVSSLESPVARKHYVLSDGNCYGQYELASTVKKILNKKAIKLHVPISVARLIASSLEFSHSLLKLRAPVLNRDRILELTGANYSCDIQAAKRDFGFEPQYNLEKGLTETLNWYKKNNWIK